MQDGTLSTPTLPARNLGHTAVTEKCPSPTSDTCLKVRRVLSLVGDKWSVFVVSVLGMGPKRFSELKRDIEGISQRMLTLTLRGLERDGLVTRTVTPIIPPRVDYELTDLGRSLREPVHALSQWAFDHIGEVDRARANFDRQTSAPEPVPPPPK